MNPTTTEPEVLHVNGRQVTVRHTDAAAVLLCERSTSHFARSVAAEYFDWLRIDEPDRPRPFRRRGWLHLLAQEQEYREQNPVVTATPRGDRFTSNEMPMSRVGPMPRIREFIRRPMAVEHKTRKTWGVEFESGDLLVGFTTEVEDPRVLIWGRSRKPDGGLYGRPIGRIDIAGDLLITADCEAAFCALMDEFEANPEEFVAAYGKRTGRCCFCRLKLTDPRSEQVGYGKICARHYSLPWGNKK